MHNLLNKFSNKKIILFSIIVFLLMVCTVLSLIYLNLDDTIFTIVLFVLLMTFSTLTTTLFQRKYLKKLDEKKKGKPYSYKEKVTIKNPLKSIKTNYGRVEILLENKVLYSLTIIKDGEIFFSEEQQQIKFGVDRKKYDNLLQFYVFDNKDYHLFKKISVLNYQAKNFFVASFIKDDETKTIYHTDNGVKPNSNFKELYENFIKLLDLDQN